MSVIPLTGNWLDWSEGLFVTTRCFLVWCPNICSAFSESMPEFFVIVFANVLAKSIPASSQDVAICCNCFSEIALVKLISRKWVAFVVGFVFLELCPQAISERVDVFIMFVSSTACFDTVDILLCSFTEVLVLFKISMMIMGGSATDE